MAILRAEFSRFRAFERLKIGLAPNAYIVGPNSAGKSTVLESIALAQQCLKRVGRQAPTLRVKHAGEYRRGYLLPRVGEEGADDPVRHEFGTAEARVSLYWENGASIHMVWPEEIDNERPTPFFYLETADGIEPRSSTEVGKVFAPLTLIPVVTPLERWEQLKDVNYVRRNASTRLASRHFRNHARQMRMAGEWDGFKTFVAQWAPEIALLDVELDAGANRLNIFYTEPGSRVPKELAWAGDGLQIWLQLLWHVFRVGDSKTIVLDEPEVYLHPDLQRRLVRLLDGLNIQVILASHSTDVISEAPLDDVLWVDRRLGQARKANSQRALSALSASLGSSYNLALARSMRARLVVASDCEDLTIIRLLAFHVGATNLANEYNVSFVPLREVSNWTDTSNLGEVIREVLPPDLPAVILLQAGQRPHSINTELLRNLSAPGNTVRFWTKAEIENYLLQADTVAKLSGAAPEAIEQRITEAVESLHDASRSAFCSASIRVATSMDSRKALLEAEEAFDEIWMDSRRRLGIVRGTQVLRLVNAWLESEGYRTVTNRKIAKSIRPHMLEDEIFNLLVEIDDLVN